MLHLSDLLLYSSPPFKSVFLLYEKARWEQVAGGAVEEVVKPGRGFSLGGVDAKTIMYTGISR